MKLKKTIYLAIVCLTFLHLWTQALAVPKKRHDKREKKEKTAHNKTRKQNVPRSALIGIRPEELQLNPAQPKEVLRARKDEVNLQTMEESQVMNVLSGKLSKLPKGEEKIVQDFLQDMERSHGELTPSVMKKMVRIGSYQPFPGRAVNRQGAQRSLGTNGKPVALPFKLGANTETFTNSGPEVGEENPSYNSNPLPEYNFKELKYNLPTSVENNYRSNDYSDNDLHGNDYKDDDLHDNDYHDNYFGTNGYTPTTLRNDLRGSDYHGNDFRGSNYHGNDFHGNDYNGNDFRGNDFNNDLHAIDEEYSKAFDQPDNDNSFRTAPDDGENKMAGIGSIIGRKGENLINEIGKKVLLNILQKQSEENTQDVSMKKVPDLLGAADVNAAETNAFASETANSLPSRDGRKALSSSAQSHNRQGDRASSIADTLAGLFSANRVSQGTKTSRKIATFLEHLGLTNTKAVTQEAQTPAENELNSNIPNDKNLNSALDGKIDISGKIGNAIDDAKVTTPMITTPTSRSTSVPMTTSTVGRKKAPKDDVASNDVVVLKISGQGKPVSFNADTSTDGSLVLKIPKKFSEKIIQSNGNQATGKNNDDIAGALPGDLTADSIKLLAGKMTKSNLFGDQPQISDWEIAGKPDKGSTGIKPAIDLHPTRNILPTDKPLSLPSLRSLLRAQDAQTQQEAKHDAKTLVQAPETEIPSTAGLTIQKQLGIFDTPNNLIKSMFPNLVGLPPGAQNIEQLMTLLSRPEQLPSTQVGTTAYDGMIPTNYAVRQNVQKENPVSMKGILKASELVEDSGVARNKGIKDTKKKETEIGWTPCTVTCGRGIQARPRPCQGKYCSGFETESRPCNAGTCPEQLAKSGLVLQNTFRRWHHSPALKWSSTLATKAQKLADDLALNNDPTMLSAEMKELPGENIAVVTQGYEGAPETAARQWYGEVKGYSFTHPSLDDSTRHFSQVVWKATRKAGIGLAVSKTSEKTYVVALYDPPGNVEGQLKKNVKMPDMRNA